MNNKFNKKLNQKVRLKYIYPFMFWVVAFILTFNI